MKTLPIVLAVSVLLPLSFSSCKKKEEPKAEIPVPKPVKKGPRFKELASLKDMAKTRVAKYAETFSKMDAKFPGTVAFGEALKSVDAAKVDADGLTVRNGQFWRATMEVRSDPAVAFAAAYLYALQGNLRRADAWLLLGNPGTDAGMKADQESLRKAVAAAEAEVEGAVKAGFALQEAKKYDEAIKAYDEVLADHPQNVRAHYEKTVCLQMKDPKATEKERQDLTDKLLALYPFTIEAYQGSAPEPLRKNLRTLTNSVLPFLQGKAKDDAGLKSFAIGSERVGAYDFAAQAQWMLTLGGKSQDQFLARYYYDLKKLGLDSFVNQTASDKLKKAVAALEGSLAEDALPAEDVAPEKEGVLVSCKAEVGMLCNRVRSNAKAALACVKRYQFEAGLGKECRKYLKSLDGPSEDEE